VLRETTSRGLCGLVCPARTSERGELEIVWKKEGGKKGSARGSVHWGCYYDTDLEIECEIEADIAERDVSTIGVCSSGNLYVEEEYV
jgi:hypothetical protein